jgi:predicted ATPase
MLRSLYVADFKCFQELALKLSPLTMLSGVNGGGKSSVIQALVLLAQTFSEREWGRTLLLNGPAVSLGSVADVLSQRSSRRHLRLGVTTENEGVIWTFKADDRRALSIELESVRIDGADVELGEPVHWLMPSARADASQVVETLRRLSWISAERAGPRELMPLLDTYNHRYIDPRGELAIGLLYWRGGDLVRPELCVSEIAPTLFHQVRAHLQDFFPGCDIRVNAIEGASAVSLQLRMDPGSDFQRPQNVGFGLIQLFPILVALLSAGAGDALIIENPEAHLHPKAQQRVGTLLAKVAASGVQVIIETHSDHVLNGLRLATKLKMIDAADVAIHFFSPENSFNPTSPKLDSDGRLDSWPEGFFDQFDHALSQLL